MLYHAKIGGRTLQCERANVISFFACLDFNWLALGLATEEEDIQGNKANTFIQ